MKRQTVDFGIDLGTTNSAIAVLEGTTPQVIRTNENAESTPSVVAFNSKGALRVGQRAKAQQIRPDEIEASDVRKKFKLEMGHPEPLEAFRVNGRHMTPEDLSAQVLRSLRADVQRRYGEEIAAAAISVPSAFELPQCAATNRAAILAGLSYSPLVQEPVAAALSYGFQTTSDRVFWLVYDFGGGTFDAAILHVRDEQIRVVNHGGDKHLGGGLIDSAIVEQLLVPVIAKEFKLPPDDRLWKSIRRILEYYAEAAKIILSEEDKTEIEIPNLFIARDGATTRFEYELHRGDVERLAEPLIETSINLCRSVLHESRLSPSDIERLILVGGPTLTPLFRDMLTQKLGIPMELRVNPLTVVACGAAIFAGTQIIPEASRGHAAIPAGHFKVELDYNPIGDETEPTIGGRVIAPQGQPLQGYTVEVVGDKTAWRSGKIDIQANGGFVATIYAERDRKNEFSIELTDELGNRCETVPDRFSYTVGITISAQTLVNNVGIGLANGDVEWLLDKGTPLPAKGRGHKFHTTEAVSSGDSGTFLRIPVVEGKNKRADRNPLIGRLEVSGQQIRRDIPNDSPIEVTITMDESRWARVLAYVPILDEEFEAKFEPKYERIEEQVLEDHSEKARARLEKISQQAELAGTGQAADLLRQIENEQLVHQMDTALTAAKRGDREAPDRCERRRIDLDQKLDEVEALIKWPVLVAEAEVQIASGRGAVEQYGNADDADGFARIEEDTRKAIASKDHDAVQQKLGNLGQLVVQVLMRHPGWWVAQLEYLEKECKGNMSNQAEADNLLVQGRLAIIRQDPDGLRTAVQRLYALLPSAMAEQLRGYRSTIMKGGF